jgi:23S rRNA A1618 N6-methylase RlmF
LTQLRVLFSVITSPEGFSNIDWKDVEAVRALNQALLKEDWQLDVAMMQDRLCPPVRLIPYW